MDATWQTELTETIEESDKCHTMLLSVDGNIIQEIEVETIRPIPETAYTLVRTDPAFKILSDEAQEEVGGHINLSMYPLAKFQSVENEGLNTVEVVN